MRLQYIKLTYRVVFPFELRLFNTSDDAEDPDRLYELFAIVVHIGVGPHHGHYIAIVKVGTKWVVFDDENVGYIDEGDISKYFGDTPGTGSGYVLFYQAKDLDFSSLGLRPPAQTVPQQSAAAMSSPMETGDITASAARLAVPAQGTAATPIGTSPSSSETSASASSPLKHPQPLSAMPALGWEGEDTTQSIPIAPPLPSSSPAPAGNGLFGRRQNSVSQSDGTPGGLEREKSGWFGTRRGKDRRSASQSQPPLANMLMGSPSGEAMPSSSVVRDSLQPGTAGRGQVAESDDAASVSTRASSSHNSALGASGTLPMTAKNAFHGQAHQQPQRQGTLDERFRESAHPISRGARKSPARSHTAPLPVPAPAPALAPPLPGADSVGVPPSTPSSQPQAQSAGLAAPLTVPMTSTSNGLPPRTPPAPAPRTNLPSGMTRPSTGQSSGGGTGTGTVPPQGASFAPADRPLTKKEQQKIAKTSKRASVSLPTRRADLGNYYAAADGAQEGASPHQHQHQHQQQASYNERGTAIAPHPPPSNSNVTNAALGSASASTPNRKLSISGRTSLGLGRSLGFGRDRNSNLSNSNPAGALGRQPAIEERRGD